MIRISVFNQYKKHRIRVDGTTRIIGYVLKREMVQNAEINIIFINDTMMIKMNRTYLRHNYPTDVICFDISDNNRLLDGEIYINIDQARRQASKYEATYLEEYARLIIHGVLHLVGYDDATPKLRNAMTVLEDKYLSQTIHRNLIKL
jgi:probable rRNA maturation factor